MKRFTILLGWAVLVSAGAAQAADPNLGRNLAATCANCHGTNGHAVKAAGLDALAGVPQAQMMQKLQQFKAGERPATIMHQIAKGYTDAQLELIAAYFAAQK